MTLSPDHQQKRQTLRRHGRLNPHPEAVTHPLFYNSDFFDPDDLVKVKYEMLRQVHVDDSSISESAQAFGIRGAFSGACCGKNGGETNFRWPRFRRPAVFLRGSSC